MTAGCEDACHSDSGTFDRPKFWRVSSGEDAGRRARQPNRATAVGNASGESTVASSGGRGEGHTARAPLKTGTMGSLVVDSRPAGTSVFVDGRLVGTTPLVLETIAVGDHAVYLDRDGYRRWATSIRVLSGERSKVSASLER